MSYPTGRRKHHYRQHDENEHRELHETAEQRLKSSILKLGEVDPPQEVARLASQLREQPSHLVPLIADAFRVGVTEQPFKIPYYAALLRLLFDCGDSGAQGLPMGKQVLEDFWKSFQSHLDKLEWREIRLCIQFFAHLTVAGVVSTQSMYDLLRSFAVVLDEFGVSHGRAKQAIRCASEGLILAAPAFNSSMSTSISGVIAIVKTYIDSSTGYKTLVSPLTDHISGSTSSVVANELLDSALSAMQGLATTENSDNSDNTGGFPRPYIASPIPAIAPFDLPSVLVPPEVLELDGLSNDGGETPARKGQWAEFYIRLFGNDVTPDLATPSGYLLRCCLCDLIDIFEVNRKECARLLLEFPKWTLPGTFRRESEGTSSPSKSWHLECTIIECVLGCLFLLPESDHKTVYYVSLITELCKLSPPSVGPAVGKSIRKMYNLLSDGLDVEIRDRLASWFSVHMSNFNFQWVWKEWLGDLNHSVLHPKRAFMRRAVEYEIRLSYYDRILKTLPEQMQLPSALVMPQQAPGPSFQYDDAASPYHDAAQSVLNLFRGRAKAEDVIVHLEELKNSLETIDSDQNVTSVIRFIAVQSLLHIGSRSFSHFLNAIERYLPLLRNLAASGISAGSISNAEARGDILDAVLAFWENNKHMVTIVFDKLMQYQIVDPTDVISWTFFSASTPISGSKIRSCNSFQWDIIKGALDKANGRVSIARRKVAALRKEEDDKAARAKVSDGTTMEIDNDARPAEPVVDSPALATALKALSSLTREQEAALAQAVSGFAACLSPRNGAAQLPSMVVTRAGWDNRNSWDESEWLSWETWGWYVHFCRMYSPYLRTYSATLSSIVSTRIAITPDNCAAKLFQQTWNAALCDWSVSSS